MNFDTIYFSHTRESDDLTVAAGPKINDYIDYRLKSETKMLQFVRQHKRISENALYWAMYGDRNV